MKESQLQVILCYMATIGSMFSDNLLQAIILLIVGFMCGVISLFFKHLERKIDYVKNSNELLKFKVQVRILEELKKLNEVKKRGLSKKR